MTSETTTSLENEEKEDNAQNDDVNSMEIDEGKINAEPVEEESAEAKESEQNDDSKPTDSDEKSTDGGIKCPECDSPANQMQLKKSTFKLKNRGTVSWIYRNKCSSSKCATWFGPFKRFERSSFVEVDEDGRPLGRARKSAECKTGPDKMESDEQVSETVENDNAEEGQNADDNVEQKEPEKAPKEQKSRGSVKPKPRKAKFKLTSTKISTIKKRKEMASKEAITKSKETKASSSKTTTTAATTAAKPRRSRGWVYLDEDGNVADEEGTASTSDATKNNKTRKSEPKLPETKSENKRTKASSWNTPNGNGGFNMLQNEKSTVETCETGAQTDINELLKSAFFEDIFNEQLAENVEKAEMARLADQPIYVKKIFLKICMTNKALAKQVEALLVNDRKYKEFVPKVTETINIMKLHYSDNLRRLRDDICELKEEFSTHHAEVIAISRKNLNKFTQSKNEMHQKYEDMQLKYKQFEATISRKEKEAEYQNDRAEYYLRERDLFLMKRMESKAIAKNAEKRLADTLYLKNHEKCAHCKVTESVQKTLKNEVVHMRIAMDKAVEERTEFEVRTKKAERCAQILGQEVDKLNYENKTWKGHIEKLKEKISQLKKEMTDSAKGSPYIKQSETPSSAANTPNTTSRGVLTPKQSLSVSCTPSSGENDRISPPEDGEIVDTPPLVPSPSPRISTPRNEPVEVVKTKPAPPPIASGFASWIPKDKLNAPAPEIPKALTPFGVPIQKKSEHDEMREEIAPLQRPLPWDRQNIGHSTSNALAAVAARVEAEKFFGVPAQKTLSISELEKKVQKQEKVEKTGNTEKAEKPSVVREERERGSSTKRKGPFGNSASTSFANNSMANFKKIPKMSDKPPPPELAKALGIVVDEESDKNQSKSIPGLSLIGGKEEKEREIEKKDDEVVVDKIKEASKPPSRTKLSSESSSSTSKSEVTESPKKSEKPGQILSPPKSKKNRNNNRNNRKKKPNFTPKASQNGRNQFVTNNPFGIQQMSPPTRGMTAWVNGGPPIGMQQQHQPSTSLRREFGGFFNESSRERDERSAFAGTLPWHRDAAMNRSAQYDNPFGNAQPPPQHHHQQQHQQQHHPMREDPWSSRSMGGPAPQREWTPLNNGSMGSFFGSPPSRPPNYGNDQRRSFWE